VYVLVAAMKYFCCAIYVLQEYDNEAEQAISDVAVHYTDTPLDIGKSSGLCC